MTEEEAKTKWCPMRRLTEIGNVRVTNVDPGIHTLNCIGSQCMMWRIDRNYMLTDDATAADVKAANERSGYCGLAGKIYG